MPSPKFPIRRPIQRHHVEPLVRTLTRKGQIFGVKFYKKDGTPRTMCCRLGVSKGVKGVGKRWGRDSHPQYLTVFDMAKDEFRHVNLDTVEVVTVKGQQLYVV